MKTYNYQGEQSYHATIQGKDIFFEKNKDLELPSENVYIRSMVEAELLVKVPTANTATTPVATTKRTNKKKR